MRVGKCKKEVQQKPVKYGKTLLENIPKNGNAKEIKVVLLYPGSDLVLLGRLYKNVQSPHIVSIRSFNFTIIFSSCFAFCVFTIFYQKAKSYKV